MKNKKVKLIALAGVTVTAAVMLTGCGNNDVKTYDKDQINVNIAEMTEANNVAEENVSIFKDTSSLNYTTNPKDDENGKIAIQKLGEDIFKTEVKDGYYVYVDNFNNSYNIKEIKSITSKYYMTGNDNWANLFKCTVNYIDNNDSNKSFDTAVVIPTDGKDAYITTPFDNYTGSTSFARGFSSLREEENTTTAKVVDIQLQKGYIEYNEYGILHAYDENGNEVWKYTTGYYPAAELDSIEYLNDYDTVDEKYVYINEGCTIVKLDKQTGNVIWKNSDFGGASSSYTFDEEDNLYIAGYYGPNLCVINKDGKTIKKLENYPNEDYFWATDMKMDSGKLIIRFAGNPKNQERNDDILYDAVVEVNTSDYSYNVRYEEAYVE